MESVHLSDGLPTDEIMLRFIVLFLAGITLSHADTIDHYMNIVSNIPKMEMKADPQAQAWARSARNILSLTNESIAETLFLSNETATQSGSPLFCIPNGVQLNGPMLSELIQQTYQEISSQQSDKDKMTVSQVALIGLKKTYPCRQKASSNQMLSVSAVLGREQ